jgi:hypothetical protein
MSNLHCIGTKLTKKYAWEANFFYLVRGFSDGLDVFEFAIDSSWYKGDHNPQYAIRLIILNVVIFEFRIYNMFHIEDET